VGFFVLLHFDPCYNLQENWRGVIELLNYPHPPPKRTTKHKTTDLVTLIHGNGRYNDYKNYVLRSKIEKCKHVFEMLGLGTFEYVLNILPIPHPTIPPHLTPNPTCPTPPPRPVLSELFNHAACTILHPQPHDLRL
jgi:hypothetical protein